MESQSIKQGSCPQRHTYILRLWQEEADSSWQGSLFNTETEERLGFGNVDDFLRHLTALIREHMPSPEE